MHDGLECDNPGSGAWGLLGGGMSHFRSGIRLGRFCAAVRSASCQDRSAMRRNPLASSKLDRGLIGTPCLTITRLWHWPCAASFCRMRLVGSPRKKLPMSLAIRTKCWAPPCCTPSCCGPLVMTCPFLQQTHRRSVMSLVGFSLYRVDRTPAAVLTT